MKGTYRAFVVSDRRGGWYACARYRTVTGGRGVAVLGEPGHGTWDQAATHAVLYARAHNQ